MKTRLAAMLVLVLVLSVATAIPLTRTAQSQPQRPEPQPPRPQLHNGVVPLGSLGHSLGAYLTIEGIRQEEGKVGACTLTVDTVNGRKLPTPVDIWVEIEALPEGRRCILKGYESSRMIGTPPAWERFMKEQGRKFHRPQAGWQVQMYFEVLAVVAPADLKTADPK